MKKDLNRALNAFAALDALPDSMILEAENTLIAAEGGRIAPKGMRSTGLFPPEKKRGVLGDFMRSGRCAAVLVGIVAIGVLLFIIRAGHNAPVSYEPPVKPAGCTIEMAEEGADFTLSMEQESYPDGTNRFMVILTAKSPGKRISAMGGWHLERLTEDGAEVMEISYTEDALISAKPGRNEYATLTKAIYGTNTGGGFPVGTYRLHATEYDGEKYVSVAYCTFTVGEPDETVTPPTDETNPPVVEYPPAEDRAYTVTTPETLEYGAKGLSITVKATEPGVSLTPHRNYRIVKLAGPANGKDADSMQTAEAVTIMPTEENGGYATYGDWVSFVNPDQWLPGLYRLYALNWDEEYVDYCDFVITGDHGFGHEMFLSQTTYTTVDTSLDVQILGHKKGNRVTWYEGWSLYAVDGDTRALVGSCAPIEIAYESLEPAPDEFMLLDIGQSIRNVTNGKYETLAAGNYELVFGYGEQAHRMPFTVVDAADVRLEAMFPDFRIGLYNSVYLYDRPDEFVVDLDNDDPGLPEHITDESLPATRTITVDGQELTLTYWYTESRNSPSDTDHYIYTQPGHAEGAWSILAFYPHGSDQLAQINYRCRDGFLLTGLPATRDEAVRVADARVKELMGSLPRFSNYIYDADPDRPFHTITYHNTDSLINTASVGIYKLSNADIVQINVVFPRYNEEQIKADISGINADLLTVAVEEYLTRYFRDSYVTFEGLKEQVYATSGPKIHYTMTVTIDGQRRDISFYVYRSNNNSDKQLISGTFLWVNGDPMLWDGWKYLPTHLLATEGVSFDGLTTGDHIEVIVGAIHETAPPTAYAYKIAAHVVGVEKAGLTEYVAWLAEMGYTVTDTKK